MAVDVSLGNFFSSCSSTGTLLKWNWTIYVSFAISIQQNKHMLSTPTSFLSFYFRGCMLLPFSELSN